MIPGLSKLPPLKARKSPVLACVIGFLFGSIGLAIYLRSLVDFVAPLVFLFVFVILHDAQAGFLIGALSTGAYGFCRVLDSNDRRAPTRGITGEVLGSVASE